MMNNIRKILLGILIVSISALAAVYVALEPVSTPAPLPGQAILPPPPPPAPPDALSGFGACPSSALGAPGTGQGTFRGIQGSYDSIGRYTLLIGLEGRVLDPAASDSSGSLSGNAAYVDFPGDIRFQDESYAESAPGPATMAKLSVHPGYTRVSLSYRNQMPPMTVKVEVKCRSDAVALRYTFDGYQPPKPLSAQGAPPQALSFPAEPASPAAITQDSASAEMALPLETAASVPQAAEPPASAEMAASLEPSPSSPSQEPPKTDSLAEEPSSPRESEPASDFAPQARDEAKSPQAPAASPQTPSTLVTISRPLLKIQAPEIHISQAPTSEPQASKEPEPDAEPSEPPPPDSQASSALTASASESAASSGNELASQSSEPSAKSTAGDSPAPSLEESDELRFYAPCKKQGPGRGTLKSFKGSYDAQGRYVLVASLEGSVGSYKFLTDRTTNPAATYIDISGSYRFEQDLDYQPAGPVRQVRVGSHPGFLRLSLTYRAGLAPKDASLEILCQEGSLAIRYAFQENKIKEAAKAAFNKANPPGRARAETDVALNKEENDSLKEALDAESSLKPSAAPQDETLSPASASSAGSPLSPESSSSPEASAGPAGASGGEASLLEADLLSAALSGEPKAEAAAPVVSPPSPILPDEIKPIDPEAESMLLEADLLASAQESKAPAQDPSPQSSQTQEVADHFAAEAALQAAGAAAVSTEGVTAALAASAAAVEGDIDELSDYRPCLQADKGQGSIGQLSGSYDRQGRFVILASLQGTVGKSKLVTDHTGEKSVTFLELSGRYRFDPDILTVRMGPVAFYRMAIHDQVTRFSLTYRDHLAPKTAAAEILCAEGKLAIRYSFHEFLDPDAAAEAAASAVLSEGPSSSASDYPSSPA
ncbi:MAG: hypothetical protein LBE49_05610, partial [Deltaproteobacteria bacterium]|nr:hypothetical protein [Deltaproteobacteria bacterium]